MNMPTILVLLVLLVVVGLSVFKVKKNGSCSCGKTGCSSCPSKKK